MIVGHALAGLGSLPRPTPAHALHGPLPLEVESLVEGVVMPVCGLGGRVTSLTSCALVPRTFRGLVDEGALAVTCHTPLLPVSGLSGPGRGLQTATGPVGCARALEVTVRILDECTRVHLAVTRPGVTGLGHRGLTTSHVTIDTGHMTARPSPLIVCGLGSGVGGLGGVAGIAWRIRSPGMAATLG